MSDGSSLGAYLFFNIAGVSKSPDSTTKCNKVRTLRWVLALLAAGLEHAFDVPPITDPGCKLGPMRKGCRAHAQKAIFLRTNHPEAEGGGSASQPGSNGAISL